MMKISIYYMKPFKKSMGIVFIENNKLYILFENAASYFYNDTSNPTQYAVDRIFAYNL